MASIRWEEGTEPVDRTSQERCRLVEAKKRGRRREVCGGATERGSNERP